MAFEFVEKQMQLDIKKVISKDCSFSQQVDNLVLLRGVLSCQSSNVATYRFILVNLALPDHNNASSLVGSIQNWVSSSPAPKDGHQRNQRKFARTLILAI